MATCKTCGKKGLFLKLNKDGNCEACEKRLQEEAERLERRRRAEEAQRRRVEAERQALLSLPLETITLNPAERKRQTGNSGVSWAVMFNSTKPLSQSLYVSLSPPLLCLLLILFSA